MSNRLTNSLCLKGTKYKLSSNKKPYNYDQFQKSKNILSNNYKINNNKNYLPIIKNSQPTHNKINKINQLLQSAKIQKQSASQIVSQQKAKNANKIVNHYYNKKDLLKNRKGLGQINPLFGCGPRRKDNRKIGGGMKISDIPTEEQETAPCPYCGRCFNYTSLAKHSSICLRVFQSKRIAFDSSSQRAIDDEHRAFMHMSKFDNYKKIKSDIPKWKKESLEFRKICQPIKKTSKNYKLKNSNNSNAINYENTKKNAVRNNKNGIKYYNNNYIDLANNIIRPKNNNVKYKLKNNSKKPFKPTSIGFMSSAPRKFITCREEYYKNLF